ATADHGVALANHLDVLTCRIRIGSCPHRRWPAGTHSTAYPCCIFCGCRQAEIAAWRSESTVRGSALHDTRGRDCCRRELANVRAAFWTLRPAAGGENHAISNPPPPLR